MDHDPAPQSLGDRVAAPAPPSSANTPALRVTRLVRGGSRGAYGPSRQVRTALDDRQTFAPVSLVALGPGAAPHTGPSCAQNPAPIAPVSPKASAPTLGGGPVCVWTVYGSCLGSWPGSSSHLTQTEGGVSGKTPCGCQATTFRFPVCLFVCFIVYRPRRDAPANTERTGATPTYLPLARLGEGGRVSHGVRHRVRHAPPPVGSLPSVCIPAGRLPGAPADRATTAGAPGRSTAHHAAGGRLES